MASKKKRCSSPLNLAMDCERLSEVSGPLAMMTGESGISFISARMTSMLGWLWIFSVTRRAKASRSTARAAPAGRADASAHSSSMEFNSLSSFLRTPEARSGRLEPSEFEQTNSARSPVRCAPVGFIGRISYKRTLNPRWATCHAASLPASPPPMMVREVIGRVL